MDVNTTSVAITDTNVPGLQTRLDEIRTLLDQAQSIPDYTAIRRKSSALLQAAKVARVTLAIQNEIAEVKIEAECGAGELLAALPKHPGGGHPSQRVRGGPPTYREQGIAYMEASRWQRMANVPHDVREEHYAAVKARGGELSSAGILKIEKKRERERKNDERGDAPVFTDAYRLFVCDIHDLTDHVQPESVDVIVTDPPYAAEYLPLYTALAQLAAKLLRPGGSLVALCGQSYLPEVMRLICSHMTYRWTCAYLTPGGQSAQVWPRTVNTFWKPLLWFVNGEYDGRWIGDVTRSSVNDNDKRFHGWGQSESGMADIVERFSEPGQLILDPFAGASTTGVVALRLGRRYIGADIDAEAIAISASRLATVQP